MASPSVGSRLVAVTSMASVSLQRELSECPETRESIRVFAKVVGLLVAVCLAPSPLWEPVTSFRVLLLRVLLHNGKLARTPHFK
jgi:hypothetical protein